MKIIAKAIYTPSQSEHTQEAVCQLSELLKIPSNIPPGWNSIFFPTEYWESQNQGLDVKKISITAPCCGELLSRSIALPWLYLRKRPFFRATTAMCPNCHKYKPLWVAVLCPKHSTHKTLAVRRWYWENRGKEIIEVHDPCAQKHETNCPICAYENIGKIEEFKDKNLVKKLFPGLQIVGGQIVTGIRVRGRGDEDDESYTEIFGRGRRTI